jgi:GWxTD domain-containing protein
MRPIYFCAGFLALAITMLSRAVVGQESLGAQLTPEYRKWLDEDVRWIMKPQERRQFLNLTSNQSRNQFVIDFWERRNPTPGSKENSFKKEHYHRLAFSNEHFAAGVAGSKTDRGRIYVVYGPPDSIVTHDSSSSSPRDEVWLYRHMKGGGDEVTLKFVDDCYCGGYCLQNEPPNNE